MADTFAESQVPFLDMAANQVELGQKIAAQLAPAFAELGLALDTFVVQNLSLPEELQKRLNERIGMNMVGDMGRTRSSRWRSPCPSPRPMRAAERRGSAWDSAREWPWRKA
jgi:membrane protease subunit (stomatin/prohibitin family)